MLSNARSTTLAPCGTRIIVVSVRLYNSFYRTQTHAYIAHLPMPASGANTKLMLSSKFIAHVNPAQSRTAEKDIIYLRYCAEIANNNEIPLFEK